MLIVPDNVIYNGAAYTYIDSFMFFANKSIEPKMYAPTLKRKQYIETILLQTLNPD